MFRRRTAEERYYSQLTNGRDALAAVRAKIEQLTALRDRIRPAPLQNGLRYDPARDRLGLELNILDIRSRDIARSGNTYFGKPARQSVAAALARADDVFQQYSAK